MNPTVTLGRVWGIPIGLHWSWFIVFALITSSLGAGYLPEEYPALPAAGLWSIAALTAVLMFVSVVLHELGHAWVARRNGIGVKQITLFVFGGIAQITSNPASAGAEFRIAIAGPIVSFGLAGMFGGLWLAGHGTDWLAAPTGWLASINLMLAVFNLIPGYPLDGGRVLRATIWQVTGDEPRASRVAAASGHVVALGFVGLGMLSVLTGNVGNGLWLILLGWFLQTAATANAQQTLLQQLLRGVTVEQLMRRTVVMLPSSATLREVVDDQIMKHGERLFLIVDDTRPRGLLTLRDVTRVPRERWETTPAGVAMEPWESLIVVTPGTELLAAMQAMDDADVAQVPVASNGTVLGTLSREEIVRYLRLRSELGS
jgi:Zn-dependent protease/predicted transcriptional regulator